MADAAKLEILTHNKTTAENAARRLQAILAEEDNDPATASLCQQALAAVQDDLVSIQRMMAETQR